VGRAPPAGGARGARPGGQPIAGRAARSTAKPCRLDHTAIASSRASSASSAGSHSRRTATSESLLGYTGNGGVEPTDFLVAAALGFALSTD
jgi:hypothetical protein